VNSIDEFVALINDELGLPVTAQDATLGFDELPGWDSVHLLWLVTALERTTSRRVSMPDVLQASSLADVYALAVQR
jgi:acyl carrier protein